MVIRKIQCKNTGKNEANNKNSFFLLISKESCFLNASINTALKFAFNATIKSIMVLYGNPYQDCKHYN